VTQPAELAARLRHEARAWQKVSATGARLVVGPVIGGSSAHLCAQIHDPRIAWPLGTLASLYGCSGQQRILLAEQWMPVSPLAADAALGGAFEVCRYQGAPFNSFEAEIIVPKANVIRPSTPQVSWWLRSDASDAPGPHNPAGYTRADTGTFLLGPLSPIVQIVDANPKRRRLFLTPDADTLAAAIAAPAGFLTLLIGFDTDPLVYPIFATAFGPAVRPEFRSTRPVFARNPDPLATWSGCWLQEAD
jgi:hypothetical protein